MSPTRPRPGPPEVIAFDVLETLYSLSSLEPLFAAAGGDPSTASLWFSRVLADGFALTLARGYRPFQDVAKAALRAVLPKAKPAARDHILAGLAELDVHPDAGPAMGRAVLDARVVVVTNGSADATNALLAKGGLDAFVETVISADDVKAWKPKADAYSFAAASVGEPAENVAMVTVHPWDVLGARNAGLVTGWCNRSGGSFPTAFGRPDATGATLVDVVDGLFSLKGA